MNERLLAKHKTGIQWTHVPGYVGATWNPTTGCTRVSPGCDHCYAFQLHDQRYAAQDRAAGHALVEAGLPLPAATARHLRIQKARDAGLKLPLAPQYDRPFSQVQLLNEKRLAEPLRARKPHAYFVDSMSDLFHEDVPDAFLDRVFAVMALSPQHLFMILTKRPERMRAYLTWHDSELDIDRVSLVDEAIDRTPTTEEQYEAWRTWPLPNAWLGVSAEDQQRADERIPVLLDTSAAVRFVSAEPLLGPIDLAGWLAACDCEVCEGTRSAHRLDWVIVGGESGQHARPFDVAWARSMVAQCRAAGVAPFVKQLGASPYTNPTDRFGQDWLSLRNRHGSDPAEWPEDLRVREWPEVS